MVDPNSVCPHNQGYYTVGAVDKLTGVVNENYVGKCQVCEHVNVNATWNCKLCNKVFCKKCQRKYISNINATLQQIMPIAKEEEKQPLQ